MLGAGPCDEAGAAIDHAHHAAALLFALAFREDAVRSFELARWA